jgi:tellurite resistance protein
MSSRTITEALTELHKLDYMPVGLFGAVMGLSGLSVAWQEAHLSYGAPPYIGTIIGWLAVLACVFISIGYVWKLLTAPEAVRAEFHHPVAGNLFGTIPISLLLLPLVLAKIYLPLAQALWLAGAVGMLVFSWTIVNRWMSDRQQVAHATPAWIIPVVGMLDIPLALPSLDLPPMHWIMVLGLSVGLFFALPLFTLVFSRLVFEEPIPNALLPSLMILIAPFAVGFSSYVATSGEVDLFAQALYFITLFMLAVLMGRLRHLTSCCPFRMSWWAVSFPLAAAAVCALRFAAARPDSFYDWIALVLLALATLVIAGLLFKTVVGVARGELRKLSS